MTNDRFHDQTRRTGARAAVLAAALAAPLPGAALQVLTATDHAELAAEVSAGAVSRIALADDRIVRIVRGAEGFAVEHDPKRGDLYLRPLNAGRPPETTTLFLGTERGFTYRLTLVVVERDAAQVLIRNPKARPVPAGPAEETRVASLVAFVRAVARREPPAGVVVEALGEEGDAGPFAALERWRGPRWTARVLAVEAETSAAGLAAALGPGVAAVWVPEADSKAPAHLRAVVVSPTTQAGAGR